MENIRDIIEQLELQNQITLQDIPEIDLYMDQVIQLFENKYNSTKRNDDEKILTKTMINNYAKGKLFFPIKNKKYSKEHLILISLIYQLKGALSIGDIKETLEGVNEGIANDNLELTDVYKSFLHLYSENVKTFDDDVNRRVEEVKRAMNENAIEQDGYLERVLLISSLVNMSNLYRRTAEKLVDDIIEKKRG